MSLALTKQKIEPSYLVVTSMFSSSCSLLEHQPVQQLPHIESYLIQDCGRKYSGLVHIVKLLHYFLHKFGTS